jgi:hypothetical protein
MEYDPGGPDLLPVTEHETGSTMIVIGLVMLIAAAGWGLFVGWDIRAGGTLMKSIFGMDVIIALVLITWGYIKKNHERK